MNDKMVSFFMNHGLKLLIASFSISAIGIIIMFMPEHYNVPLPPKLGQGIVVAGLSMYLISRIGMAIAQRQTRKADTKTVEDSDKKEDE